MGWGVSRGGGARGGAGVGAGVGRFMNEPMLAALGILRFPSGPLYGIKRWSQEGMHLGID